MGEEAAAFPELRTARLDLIAPAPEHAEAFLTIYADPVVMAWYPRAPCADEGECRRIVEDMGGVLRDGTGYRWSLQRRADRAIIGAVGFHAWNRAAASARFSYELVPSARGQGFAQEAARAVLSYGSEVMRLRRVVAEIHAGNAASIRLAQRLGFVRREAITYVWKGQVLPFEVWAR